MLPRVLSFIAIAVAAWLTGCAVSPAPLTDVELTSAADANQASVTANQEPVSGDIALYEAMARALKYNLDHRVEEAEAAVRMAELDLSHYSLLPNMVANSGYAGRDNYNASSSLNLVTDTPNFGASTSQEKEIKSADIGFTWNVIDFGLSYVRARQSADKYLVQEEMRRKVIQRIVEDVRSAYWRAISADRLMAKLTDLEGETRVALAETRRLYDTLEARLEGRQYVAGDYSIADIAIWPWVSRFVRHKVDLADFPSIRRWYLELAARPAVIHGYAVPHDTGAIPLP